MSSLNLVKGERLALTKENPGVSSIAFGLGWDANAAGKDTFDLDASVILIGAGGKAISPEATAIVCFANLTVPGIVHSGDELTGASAGDDETITVTMKDVETRVERMAFLVNIYDAAKKGQNFGQVNNAYIRAYDTVTNNEIMRYDLTEDYSSDTGVFAGEFYRAGAEWKFNAMGQGVSGDLRTIFDAFQ